MQKSQPENLSPEEMIRELKLEILNLVKSGITYKEISQSVDYKFTADAIKMFAHRKSKSPRVNDLVRALGKSIEELKVTYEERIDNELKKSKINKDFRSFDNEFVSNTISSKFRKLRNSLIPTEFPDFFYFCRMRADSSPIILKVNITKCGKSTCFEIKVIGRRSSRIIVGDISGTLGNICFSGMSFPISNVMERSEVTKIRYFDGESVNKYINSNPIGLEFISFPTLDLQNSIFPVFFSGVDGKGDPLIGRGIFINGDDLSESQVIAIDEGDQKKEICKIITNYVEEYKLFSAEWISSFRDKI